MSPTDMQHQLWAQALGGDGYAMAFVLFAIAMVALCILGIVGSVLEERQRRIAKEQRRLERSVSRARSASCYSQSFHRTGSTQHSE